MRRLLATLSSWLGGNRHADKPVAGQNALSPDLMTADERLAEIAQILARGFVRLHARKSTPLSAQDGDSSFDFSPDRSSHVDSPGRRKAI